MQSGEGKRFVFIPVRLKVDRDMYNSLIEPLKESKELSSFIVSMFEAYNEVDDIRELIDRYMDRNNPLNKMQEQLDKIVQNHRKSMALVKSASMELEEVSSGGIQKLIADEVAKQLAELGAVSRNTNTNAEIGVSHIERKEIGDTSGDNSMELSNTVGIRDTKESIIEVEIRHNSISTNNEEQDKEQESNLVEQEVICVEENSALSKLRKLRESTRRK